MKPLHIFSFITEQTGVGLYRMDEPMRMLEKQGKIKWGHNPYNVLKPKKNSWLPHDVDGLKETTENLDKYIRENGMPDLFHVQRYDNPFFFTLCLGLGTLGVPVVQETDDYVYDVPLTNTGAMSYRDRDDAGDINDALGWARKSLGHFDAYIVTTKFLKDFYSKTKPTYICPNSIDLSRRKFLSTHKHQNIRIGFSSSGAHQEGLDFIVPVVDELMEKHDNITFYFYQGLFDRFSDKPYKDRVKKLHWVPVDKYPKYLASLSLDIAIAPLTDRLFNRGKSNLRLLEYWSSGHYPVIASRVSEYASTIKDGVNGFLAGERNEWIEKIEKLIADEKLRDKLGEAGYQTVLTKYNLEKNAAIWERAFRDIIKHYKPGSRNPLRDSEGVESFRSGNIPH